MENGMLTLQELSDRLSISRATGRNWLRLGRLSADAGGPSEPLFSPDTAERLLRELAGEGRALRKRRNKTFLGGHRLYRNLLRPDSANLRALEELELRMSEDWDERRTRCLLAECALQLAAGDGQTSRLQEWLASDACRTRIEEPLRELIGSPEEADRCLMEHPECFRISFAREAGEDLLGALDLLCRDRGQRQKRGMFYTPARLVRQMIAGLSETPAWQSKEPVLDPCCGSGGFLLQLPPELSWERIRGLDIDPVSVQLARINVLLARPEADPESIREQIRCADFLGGSEKETCGILLGNPPWGSQFAPDQRPFLRSRYRCAREGQTDSADLFLEESLRRLSEGGVFSFVLPESLLTVRAHAPIRSLLAEQTRIQRVSAPGNIFEDVQCPCVILQARITHRGQVPPGYFPPGEPHRENDSDRKSLAAPLPNKKATDRISREIPVQRGDQQFVIRTERVPGPNGWNLLEPDEDYRLTRRLMSLTDAERLKGRAVFALGIVTGDNRRLLHAEPAEGLEPVWRGSDIGRYRIGSPSAYLSFAPEQFQQAAPLSCYRAEEKLLYRFVGDRLCFALDTRKRLTLNSCNLLIPRIPGCPARYVLAVLNSRVLQYLYQKEFHSLKVLRSILEQLPIPHAGAVDMRRAEQLTIRLEHAAGKEREALDEELDLLIEDLFSLTGPERERIRTQTRRTPPREGRQ